MRAFRQYLDRLLDLRWRYGQSPLTAVCEQPSEQWPLDQVLLAWNDREKFRLRDAVCGCQVFGATGSGKSSGSVAALTRSYLQHGFGAVFFTAKPDDAQAYLGLCCQSNRTKDVVLMGPKHETTFNFISEAALGKGGLVGNLTSMLTVAARLALGGTDGGGGREDGGFWVRMETRLLSSSAELLILAGIPVTTANLERLATDLPSSREQVGSSDWQKRSFVFSCLQAAEERACMAEEQEDVRRLAGYFLSELAELSSKTRGTVQSSVTAILDLFNRRDVRRLLSSPTPSFDMSMLQEGKILILDMPVMSFQAVGRLVQMVVKYCVQLAQNRRDLASNPRPVALIADESHLLTDLEHDATFQTTARSTRTCTLYATQSISNYLSENGGAGGGGTVEARVHALLSNLQCQVFHQSTDTKTIEYAQSLFGKVKRLLMNGGTNQQQESWVETALGLGGGGQGTNAGFSEQVDYLLQAGDFHDLACGGPSNDFTVEALLYQGGRSFTQTGQPFLPVRFAQRPNLD